VARDLTAETAGFPFVAQAARVHRQREDGSAETVALIASRPAHRLSPRQWLGANINHWTIKTGLHARLDVSRDDDRCRLRQPKGGLAPRHVHSLGQQPFHPLAQSPASYHHRFYHAHG